MPLPSECQSTCVCGTVGVALAYSVDSLELAPATYVESNFVVATACLFYIINKSAKHQHKKCHDYTADCYAGIGGDLFR